MMRPQRIHHHRHPPSHTQTPPPHLPGTPAILSSSSCRLSPCLAYFNRSSPSILRQLPPLAAASTALAVGYPRIHPRRPLRLSPPPRGRCHGCNGRQIQGALGGEVPHRRCSRQEAYANLSSLVRHDSHADAGRCLTSFSSVHCRKRKVKCELGDT